MIENDGNVDVRIRPRCSAGVRPKKFQLEQPLAKLRDQALAILRKELAYGWVHDGLHVGKSSTRRLRRMQRTG